MAAPERELTPGIETDMNPSELPGGQETDVGTEPTDVSTQENPSLAIPGHTGLGDILTPEEEIEASEDVVGAESFMDKVNNPDFNPEHPREGYDTVETSQELVDPDEAGVLQEPSQLLTEHPVSSNKPDTVVGHDDDYEASDGGMEKHDLEEPSSKGGAQKDEEGAKEMLNDVHSPPATDDPTDTKKVPDTLQGADIQREGSSEAAESITMPEMKLDSSETADEGGPQEPHDIVPEEAISQVGQKVDEEHESESPQGIEMITGTQDDPVSSVQEKVAEERKESAGVEDVNTTALPETSDVFSADTQRDVTPGEAETLRAKSAEQHESAGKSEETPSMDETGQQPDSAPEEPKGEVQVQEPEATIPENLFYDYDSICSQPFITPDSGIPRNVLHLLHSFGYDCTRRANLHLLDDRTLLYVAGTITVILTLKPPEQRYLRSSSGGGIGAVAVHPSKKYFAVAEKGKTPNIVIYEYPSLKPYRILRGGTMEAYAFVDFNASGTLLASVGSNPDYMLTLWDWKQENTMLRSKAFSQDVFQVTFSPENEEQLTTCGTGHIKFWQMAHTFTGLKLQGELGRFGKTSLTDIEGYVELPDGKVISGSEWGNMLLWEGGLIKVELCRKGRRPCHNGPINQFVLDEGELITIGVDGYVRVWDFETVDTADTIDDTGLLEMEPMNELSVGKHVNLQFMVKMAEAESPMWFAQDANGAVWKLDLSFSNITQDPECILSFHSRNITALDASPSTHLMASTSMDRSVRIYDFVGKHPLAEMNFKQGGTALVWAPRMVNPKGGLFVSGFEDGVVRILEVYNPQGFRLVAGRTGTQDAEISLKQAFKPHTAPVTALSYERNGEMLATGSEDKTVFFFAVGEKYEPIGFVRVPGPVMELHWSPASHEQNMLLVLCKNGYAIQIPAPEAEKRDPVVTYEIPDLPLQYFRFSSIKSKIEREEEIARRQKEREEKKKELEAWIKQQKDQGVELTEEEIQQKMDEEEEALPPLYTPENPSSILCGFYATPGKFWLSLDGYDAGYLYLCEFADSDRELVDQSVRRDEPIQALPIEDTSQSPIYKTHFSSNKQLLFCGMQDGSVRVYPLQANDALLTSMHGYWSLGIHDNQYGTIRAICCSYDNQYLMSCGADGNIFTFSILSMEDIERDLKVKKAKVPSPRRDLEGEKPAEDIDDPTAYSIENAKQKRQYDLQLKQAEEKKAAKRQELEQLRDEFRLLLGKNTELPAHMQLGRAEFEMDPRIREEMERQTSERIRTLMKELAWEQEKHNIGLKKLQERFRNDIKFDTVTVHSIITAHRVSTYRLGSLSEKYKVKGLFDKTRQTRYDQYLKEAELSRDNRELGKAEQSPREERQVAVHEKKQTWAEKSRAGGQLERMKKIVEKTEKVKSKISNRKREWAELYNQKPSEDYEDPKDVLAIKNAKENMGDFKLKTASDYTVPEHLRTNAEKKRNELAALECMIHEKKKVINLRILSLRDFKVDTIKEIQGLVEELTLIQSTLDSSMHLPVPPVPCMLPEEMPEKKFQVTSETLVKFKLEQESKITRPETLQQTGFGGLGEFGSEKSSAAKQDESPLKPPSNCELVENWSSPSFRPPHVQKVEMSDLEKEIMQMEESKNIYRQEMLIKKIHGLVADFDAELQVLRHQKLKLDVEMKMGDLRHITLFEELLLLKDFEKREDNLQERVSDRMVEKEEVQRKSEDYLQQLETKKKDIAKLQEKEKALLSTFQTSLGENNKFAVFLTKVFKKKVKRTKKEVRGDDEDVDSDDDSDVDSSWDSVEDDSGSDGDVLDDSICPENCDPALFENTLCLREKRLDIEEALTEEKKIVDNLKKEYDALSKKVKVIDVNLKAAEEELDAFQREKQQKLNELHVVVPLKLHQVEYTVNGEIPSDLAQALVFSRGCKESLEQRIEELKLEKEEQAKLYKAAREQHKKLIRERKEMEAKIQKLEDQCRLQMMRKFGRIVDLESLQTLSVNTNLEELKIKSSEHQRKLDKEIGEWEVKVMEVKKRLMEVTREQTQKLEKMNELLTEMKSLEAKLDALQTNVGEEFQGPRNTEVKERQKLLQVVEMQAEEMENLKEEISLLSKKGGSILPPAHPQVPMPHSSSTMV